ncbi:MAG: DMT family transporter [Microgenomates group bacterium]
MTPHRTRAYIYLLIVAAIWGIAGPVIKFTLGGIDPLPFLTYRLVISATFSIIFFLIKGVKLPDPKTTAPLVFLYGILAFTIALGTLFVGLEKTTVLDLTLITLSGPLLVTIGGILFFKDHITRQEKIGISIVLLGSLFTIFSPIIMNHSDVRLSGNLFIFLFLLADSSAVLLAKRIVQLKVPPLTLINLGFVVGAITIIPITGILYGFPNIVNSITSLSIEYHLGVFYMALLSGTLAYFLSVLGQKSIEVSEAVLFRYLQPLFATPLAIFWLGEQITASFIFGAVIIGTGVVIAEYKKRR